MLLISEFKILFRQKVIRKEKTALCYLILYFFTLLKHARLTKERDDTFIVVYTILINGRVAECVLHKSCNSGLQFGSFSVYFELMYLNQV